MWFVAITSLLKWIFSCQSCQFHVMLTSVINLWQIYLFNRLNDLNCFRNLQVLLDIDWRFIFLGLISFRLGSWKIGCTGSFKLLWALIFFFNVRIFNIIQLLWSISYGWLWYWLYLLSLCLLVLIWLKLWQLQRKWWRDVMHLGFIVNLLNRRCVHAITVILSYSH
jgi:hypothetical protein